MKRVVGAFEKVSFPDFGVYDVVAKIDTGALSGAFHATGIKRIKLATGEKAVSYLPFGKKPRIKLASFVQKEVRSSNGKLELRYVVPTTIIVRGVQYPIQISLADRTNMMKGVLVGRGFLRRHGFIVDAKKGTKYRYDVK